MAYQSNLLNDIVRRQGQRRALTGIPSTYQETRGLYDSALDYDAKKAEAAGLREQRANEFNASLDLQKKAQQGQELASMVGGAGQLAMLPIAYKSAKDLGLFGASKAAVPAAAPNLLGTAPAVATTAQGAVAPLAASTTAQGAAVAAPAIETATAAGGATAETAALATGAGEAGLLGTAGAVALPATLGSVAGGLLGGPVSKALGTHPKTTKDVMSIGGGAAAGFVVGGPIGAVIGGAIGAISSLF